MVDFLVRRMKRGACGCVRFCVFVTRTHQGPGICQGPGVCRLKLSERLDLILLLILVVVEEQVEDVAHDARAANDAHKATVLVDDGKLFELLFRQTLSATRRTLWFSVTHSTLRVASSITLRSLSESTFCSMVSSS